MPIEIHYVHTVNSSVFEDGNAWCRLHWSSIEVNQEVVPEHYLFTKIPNDPIKLGDFDAKWWAPDTLNDSSEAFFDDKL